MASVNSSNRSSESYDAEWASLHEKHEKAMNKAREDEEKTLTSAKKEYQDRLRELRDEANEEVRKMKEDGYDSQGRRFTTMERENLEEKRRISDAYEASLAKAEQSRKEQEQTYEAKLDYALSEANERSKSQTQQQKKEFTRLAEDARREANDAKKVYEAEIAKEKVRSQKSTESIVADNNASTNRALAAHSAMYDEHLKESAKRNQAAINEKNQEIADLKSTGDLTKISPEAKRKLEETYQKRFSQDLMMERNVNAATIAAMRNRDEAYQQNMRDAYAQKYNEMSKDLRSRHLTEKRELVQGYEDLEAHADQTQRRLMDRQTDQAQRTYMKHANEMSMQEQRNLERLKDQREALVEDKMNEKEQLEHKQRATEREFTYKMTDMRREFEKKLLDQKDQNDREKEQAKFEFDRKLQEQQKVAQRNLNDRVKDLEGQLKQQESMFKEHDRLLTEHYEEELDKLKRTNARIIQTKS